MPFLFLFKQGKMRTANKAEGISALKMFMCNELCYSVDEANS